VQRAQRVQDFGIGAVLRDRLGRFALLTGEDAKFVKQRNKIAQPT
jgi:hypothetical protein